MNVKTRMTSSQHMAVVMLLLRTLLLQLNYVLLFPCVCSGLPIHQQQLITTDSETDATVPYTFEQVSTQPQYTLDHTTNKVDRDSHSNPDNRDPAWTRHFTGEGGTGFDSSFIENFLPDIIVHDSAAEFDTPLAPPPVTTAYRLDDPGVNQDIQSDNNNKRESGNKVEEPPTAFHQDVYVDVEDLLKQLRTDNQDTTTDLDTPDIDDDLLDLWHRYYGYPPNRDRFNPGLNDNTVTEATTSVTSNPQLGYVNGQVSYNFFDDQNTNNNYEGNSFVTTLPPINSDNVGPLEPNYPLFINDDSSDSDNYTTVPGVTDNAQGDTNFPYNDQEAGEENYTAVNNSNIQGSDTNYLGITQQPAYNNNSQGITQTADYSVVIESTIEGGENSTKPTTETSIYIPQEDIQNSSSSSSNDWQFIVTNGEVQPTSLTIRTTAALTHEGDSIDVTKQGDYSDLNSGAIYSGTTASSIDTTVLSGSVDESINNNYNAEVTTASYFNSNTVTGSVVGDTTELAGNNSAAGNTGDTNDGKETDHTDSRDTGIILGSTLTLAAVIVIGIMITVCCACLRKNKGDKCAASGDDEGSEESYGFTSMPFKRTHSSPPQEGGDVLSGGDNGVGDHGATDTRPGGSGVHEVPLPQPPQQKSSGIGFSIASLTWKRRQKKKE